MTNLTLHLETPSQRPPATTTVSTPAVDAVAGRAEGDNNFSTKTPGHEGSMRGKPL